MKSYADVIQFLKRVEGTLAFIRPFHEQTLRFQMCARRHTIEMVITHKETILFNGDILELKLCEAAKALDARIGS